MNAELRNSTYCVGSARLEDLKSLHRFYEKQFYGDAPSYTTMVSWYTRDPSTFQLVTRRRQNDADAHIVGSYKLLALNESAIELLRTGSATGSNLPVTALMAHGQPAVGYYLGDVAGDLEDRDCLWRLMRSLVERIEKVTVPVFARALSSYGLKWMKHFDFRPLDPSEELRERIIAVYRRPGQSLPLCC
jgi:hypothetical protein